MLKGNKVYLKLIEKEGLGKRVEWINDPDIQKTLNYDYPTSLARTESWFYKVVMDLTRRDFEVYDIENDKYIGFAGLMDIKYPVMKAEFYAVIGDKTYWRGGYGTEVYKILVDYGFKELGLNKIYGFQLLHNEGAHRVIEKLGWKRDGLLRQDLYSHGKIVDRYIVSILREDWAKSDVYKDLE
jgi:RimJ/RimL family protein N-acetyltransferase